MQTVECSVVKWRDESGEGFSQVNCCISLKKKTHFLFGRMKLLKCVVNKQSNLLSCISEILPVRREIITDDVYSWQISALTSGD